MNLDEVDDTLDGLFGVVGSIVLFFPVLAQVCDRLFLKKEHLKTG